MFGSIIFEVIGDSQLHCEGCEERLEKTLKKLQGVGKVRARARDQRIEVLFDAEVLDPAAISERIAEAGYQTKLIG